MPPSFLLLLSTAMSAYKLSPEGPLRPAAVWAPLLLSLSSFHAYPLLLLLLLPHRGGMPTKAKRARRRRRRRPLTRHYRRRKRGSLFRESIPHLFLSYERNGDYISFYKGFAKPYLGRRNAMGLGGGSWGMGGRHLKSPSPPPPAP